MKMNKRIRHIFFVSLFFILLPISVSAEGREGSIRIGNDIGFQLGTVDDTAFALGAYGDYFLSNEFGIGPLLQFGLTDDLFQFGMSLQVKGLFEVFDYSDLFLEVQAGLGFIHTDLERGKTTNTDTSVLVPLGMGLDYRLSEQLSISAKLLFNITNLKLGDMEDDEFHTSLFFGINLYP
ncbi:MAG: outer membrane beta-barrel protein [Nitrospinae bacterium]|nr:outer membrane beta-barrel protein [Nitrospinota bacterium]